MSEKELKLLSGDWDGEYTDSYGHKGKLRFKMDVKETNVLGDFELTVKKPDKPWKVAGKMKGVIQKGNNIEFTLEIPDTEKGVESTPKQAKFKAHLRSAGSYAHQSLIGIADKMPMKNFGGGVWVAWRFKEKKE